MSFLSNSDWWWITVSLTLLLINAIIYRPAKRYYLLSGFATGHMVFVLIGILNIIFSHHGGEFVAFTPTVTVINLLMCILYIIIDVILSDLIPQKS